MKKAFTMIELIFVIVILGILASVAIPRLSLTRDDAAVAKGRADIASIRSAIISHRQTRLIAGTSSYIDANSLDVGGLFGAVLMYGIADRNDTNAAWTNLSRDVNTSTYNYQINGVTTTFTYTKSDGTFNCVANTADCNSLTNWTIIKFLFSPLLWRT